MLDQAITSRALSRSVCAPTLPPDSMVRPLPSKGAQQYRAPSAAATWAKSVGCLVQPWKPISMRACPGDS